MSRSRRNQTVANNGQDQVSLRPVLILLVGASGAGKTTFYECHLKNAFPRLLKGSSSPLEQSQAERELGFLMKAGESFVYMSTFFDTPTIRDGRAAGYDVKAIYVGTEDPDLNLGRVLIRVSHGGPFAPVGRIVDDVSQGLKQLLKVSRLTDDLMIFDNTAHARTARLVAHFRKGTLAKLTRTMPKWAQGLAS